MQLTTVNSGGSEATLKQQFLKLFAIVVYFCCTFTK